MSFDLVLFGGTGDLAWRKLLPALFQAWRHGSLPPGGRVIAVAREPLDAGGYRTLIGERLAQGDPAKRPDADEFTAFSQMLHYVQVDLGRVASYEGLVQVLQERPAAQVVFYLATAASLFEPTVRHLAATGLNMPRARIVLEKPLGHDLASNQAINQVVREFFSEEQIFRIDHYLGKPSVQNLLAIRFGNALFEPLWRREHIASIEISIAEDLGVEQRGAFYDSTGALRDMVQNHALQLLCAMAMEPPISSRADAIRDEKLKVLRSLKPWTPQTLANSVVRGQYTAGVCGGDPVPGYREEPGVRPDSRTETYVALRAEIASWRWAGVPFYIRTGKRLAQRDARIVVNFRPAPHAVFDAPWGAGNQLVIHLQPKDGLEMHLFVHGQPMGTRHGSGGPLTPVHLDLDFDKRFGAQRVGAYERLLVDAIDGRLNLFVRTDEQEEAWRWVEPVLNDWSGDKAPLRTYAAGSWGPSAASAMIARDGACWNEES